VVADDVDVAARRERQLDAMADMLDAHLEIDAVTGLLDGGPPLRPTLVATLHK
jgi:adenosylcobyric acid synthase